MNTIPIIAVFNAKGGVGKTTTVVNLAACLAALGRKVVVVDLDGQGNASASFAIADRPSQGAYDLITGKSRLDQVVMPTRFDNVSIIAATDDLVTIDIELAVNAADRGGILRHLLDELPEGSADMILIDCPPAISAMTVNALSSAHAVIVPANPTPFAHDGLMRTWRIVKRLAAGINPSLFIAGILLTQAEDDQTDEGIEGVIRAEMGGLLYPLRVPHAPRLFVPSSAHGLPACVYDPDSPGAAIYLDLAELVIADEPRLHRVAANLPHTPPALPRRHRAEAENTLAGWHAKARNDGLLDGAINIPAQGNPLPAKAFINAEPQAMRCTTGRLFLITLLGAAAGAALLAAVQATIG